MKLVPVGEGHVFSHLTKFVNSCAKKSKEMDTHGLLGVNGSREDAKG